MKHSRRARRQSRDGQDAFLLLGFQLLPVATPMKLAEGIAFYILCALIFVPWIGYIALWMLNINDVSVEETLVGTHIAGLVGMIVWCVLFLKPYPRLSRVGLVLATLFLAFWAYALFT
jgi:hypothetical protein